MKFLEKIAKLETYIAIALTTFQVIMIFHPISVKVSFIVLMLSLLLFILSKDFLDEKFKKIGFKFFLANFALFFMDLFGIVYYKLKNLSHDSKFPLVVLSVFMLSLVLLVLMLLTDKERREKLTAFYDKPIFNSEKTRTKKVGDIVLCEDLETRKPVILPFEDRFLHMLILGATGSGKTSQVIIPMINQDMQNKDCGITVIEPKGDLADKVMALGEYYGRKAIYFNPTDPDCPSFNPLYGDEVEVIENMATTFKMLNTDSSQYFLDMNDTFIRNALKVVKRTKKNQATMTDLLTIAYNTNGLGKEMINELSRLSTKSTEEKKENDEISSWFTTDYYNSKSKTYEHCSGIRNQISKINSNKYLRKVLNPTDGKNDLDFSRALANGEVLAISTAQGELRDLGKYLGYFIILNLQSAVFKRPGNENTRKAHFLYIDEFQTYANSGFSDMLTQGRSYRVSSTLATQNRALIGMGAGREGADFTELVSTNARNIVLFPGCNAKDAQYYSNEFGEVTEKKVQKSISRPRFMLFNLSKGWGNEGIREVETTEARFSPSDIIYRSFGEVMYRIVQNKSVQPAGVGKVSWIDKDLNDTLNDMIDKYNDEQDMKRKMEEYERILNINHNKAKDFHIDPLNMPSGEDSDSSEDSSFDEDSRNRFSDELRNASGFNDDDVFLDDL